MSPSWLGPAERADAGTQPFPAGWVVLVALGIAFGLLFSIVFISFPRLRNYSGGIDPFDARFGGYSAADAGALLDALGARGRAYYVKVQLRLDAAYPATYAVSRALAMLWLAAPGRAFARGLAPVWKVALVAVPVLVAVFDWAENAWIGRLIADWPNLTPSLVARASTATMVKSAAGLLSEATLLGLFVIFLWRRARGWRRA